MREEIASLIRQGVFKRVKRRNGMRVLKGRWVYKIKLGPNNEVLRRKARFVVKGFIQQFGKDYFETHSPVARVKSIKLILSTVCLIPQNGSEFEVSVCLSVSSHSFLSVPW